MAKMSPAQSRPPGVPGAAGRHYRRGIVEPDDHRDELPAELNAAEFVGPYLFPNNNRRRIPALLYVVIAGICIAVWALRRDHEPVLVNGGVLIAGIVLLLWALYHWQAGWNLAVDENDALVAATRAVGFPVGHASAQLGWRGIRSRPTWRILLYSTEPQPAKRGLVLVDGIDAEVVGQFVEKNPEDFSDYDG
jgi:hypothetical protein